MILDCLTCHHPIPAKNGSSRAGTDNYMVVATCNSCGAIYRVVVTELTKTRMDDEELKRVRNKTS